MINLIVKSKHLFLIWVVVIMAVIALRSQQMLYLGLVNAANVHISHGLIPATEENSEALIAGIDLLGLIEQYEFPVGSELLRLRGLAKLSINGMQAGQADLIQAAIIGNPLADYALARWYTSQGNWPQAATYFDSAQPENNIVINQTIDRLIKSDHQADAIQLASEYVRVHPDAPATYYRLANLHWSNGNRQETIQALTNALTYDLEKDSYYYRYQTAKLNYLQENYPAAASVIENLLDEYPSEFAVLYLAGQIYSSRKDYSRAEQLLLAAIEQNPKHLHAHISLALAYQEQSKFLESASEYRQAVLLASDPSSYLDLLADTYKQAGEHCRENETLRILELASQKQVDFDTEFQNMDRNCSP